MNQKSNSPSGVDSRRRSTQRTRRSQSSVVANDLDLDAEPIGDQARGLRKILAEVRGKLRRSWCGAPGRGPQQLPVILRHPLERVVFGPAGMAVGGQFRAEKRVGRQALH